MARCDPTDRRRRPTTTGRGSRLWASAWRWRPTPPPRMATSGPSPSAATSPTVEMPRACSFSAVAGPTPHSRSTGSGWRNVELPVGLDEEQPVGLGHAAGHLGQELGAGDPDGDGQPDVGQHLRPQPAGDLDRRPGDPPEAADVEERLVDRQPLDERRGVAEHLEHGLAGVGVGREPGPHDDRVRAQPQRLAPAHGRAHAVRLGLVAGGEHDAAADDDRAAAQARRRHAARRRRRTRRGRRAGCWPRRPRTHVRTAVKPSGLGQRPDRDGVAVRRGDVGRRRSAHR